MAPSDQRETRSSPPPASEAKSEIGALLAGRYQVGRELGGAAWASFLCRDLAERRARRAQAPHAPGGRAAPEDTWWFQEEARALAGLAHPAIVRARDFGPLEDGTPYLAMDAVPGRSLHEWIYLAHTDGRFPGRSCGRSSIRCSARSRTPTRAASSTAISSPPTSCSTSRPTAGRARTSSISASPG